MTRAANGARGCAHQVAAAPQQVGQTGLMGCGGELAIWRPAVADRRRREAPHLALPLTRRLVGDLGSIVRVLISDVDHGRHHGAARGGVGAQLIGDQSSRDTALGFQQLPKESDGCSPIPVRLHEDVQDVTILVYRAPQILVATLDRDEDLVEMPSVSHPTASAPQPPRVDRTEPLAPLPNRLVGDRHASLREEIFSIAEAEAESMVEPDGVANDLGGKSISMVARRVALHRPSLPRSH